MQREGGAAGTVEGERLLAQFRGNLVEPVDKALIDRLGLAQAGVAALHQVRQLAHMGVVTHEAGERQMAGVGGDALKQCVQLPGLGEPATVQTHVDFHVDAQPAVQPPGQFQVLLQPRVAVDQPLQLAVRVEAGVLRQFLIEAGGGPHRHGLAEQQVAARLRLGHGVDERLVEHHHPVGAGLRHHFPDQWHAGQ